MMFLTPGEVKALTGKARVTKQKEVLEALGIRYIENGIGEVIVSRSHVEYRLGGSVDEAISGGQPNFEALRKVS